MTADIVTHVDTDLVLTDSLPLDQQPALAYMADLPSEHTRRNVQRHLNIIADMLLPGANALTLKWGALGAQHTAAVKSALAAQYKPTSANVMLASLRGVIKWAWRLGYMTEEQRARACDFKPIKGSSLPAGRDIATGEIGALLAACHADETASGIRDAAMIGLLYVCGLRRAEMAHMQFADVDTSDPTRIKVFIRGKGSKEREDFVENGALEYLRDWLKLRGEQGGALFIPIRKGGHITRATDADTLQGITAQAIYAMLKKRGQEAGLADFTPHDFRRTVAGDLLDAGVDLATVANKLGHANIETTRRYDRRGKRALQTAASKLHVPYRKHAASTPRARLVEAARQHRRKRNNAIDGHIALEEAVSQWIHDVNLDTAKHQDAIDYYCGIGDAELERLIADVER